MSKPSIPANESARLQALRALQILDTPREERFDRLTRITRHILQVPIVMVSLVDEERRWVKSSQGLEASEIPREISFCAHAILEAEVFVVPDASLDARFADNPMVAGAPNIGFYAGAPLVLDDGQRVGTLCAMDYQPRELSAEQLALLLDLAQVVVDELQIRSALSAASELRDHEERLHSVLDTVVDGIVTIDARGLIQTVNRAIEKIFGYPAKELLGRNVNVLMPEPYHSGQDDFLDNYLKSGQPKVIGIGREVEGLRNDGSTFPMELAVGEMKVQGQRMFTGIVRDITERKNDEGALLKASRLVESIAQTVVDAIITINPLGIVQTFNLAAERMFGYSADEVIGVNIKSLMPDPYSSEHDGYLEHYLETNERKIIGIGREVLGLRKDGSTFPLDLAVSELKLGKTRIFTGIVRDITERKMAEAELVAAKEQAEESDRLKSTFLATMSHELRTPLNSIIGFTGIVIQGLAGPLTDEQDKQLHMVQGSARHLLALINDILDISKIEAGQLEIQPVPFEMHEAVRKVAGVIAPLAEQRGLGLEIDVASGIGIVVSDRRRVEQILINLTNNAVKFTDAGTVRIECEVVQDQVVTRIVDTGIGIEPGELTTLFEPFQQIETGLNRTHEGTGLGLSICTKLAGALGGRIHVESKLGTGSTFTFSFPSGQVR